MEELKCDVIIEKKETFISNIFIKNLSNNNDNSRENIFIFNYSLY